jgi:hypothetical protein
MNRRDFTGGAASTVAGLVLANASTMRASGAPPSSLRSEGLDAIRDTLNKGIADGVMPGGSRPSYFMAQESRIATA